MIEFFAHVWLILIVIGIIYFLIKTTDKHFWKGVGIGLIIIIFMVLTIGSIGIVLEAD